MRTKYNGSVSLFTAMVFLLIAAVIAQTIRSARLQASEVMVGTSLSLGLDSVFAEYDRDLFEEYGVLFLDGSDEEGSLEEERLLGSLTGYTEGNLDSDEGLLFSGGRDLYGIDLTGIEITDLKKATDESGLLWLEEVVGYEKYAKIINLAADYLNIDTSSAESGSSLDYFGMGTEILSIMSYADQIDTTALSLMQSADGVQLGSGETAKFMDFEGVTNFAKCFLPHYDEDRLDINYIYAEKRIYNYIRNNYDDPAEMLEEALDSLEDGSVEDCKTYMERFRKVWQEAYYGATMSLKMISSLYQYEEDLGSCVDRLGDMIEEGLGIVSEIYGEDLSTSLEELKDYDSVVTKKILNIADAEEGLEKATATLESIKAVLEQCEDETDPDQLRDYIKQLVPLTDSYSCEGIHLQYEDIIDLDDSYFDIWGTISGLFTEGAISLVLPDGDTLSKREVNTEDLASKSVSGGSLTSYTDVGNASVKRMIYDEYVMDNFASYTDQERGPALNYEVEYILGGQKKDSDNLTSVVSQLMGIRMVANFILLMTDSERKSTAESIATSMVEWTENEYVIKIVKYLLLIQWANVESMYDVKILLSGGKVPLIKKKEHWQSTIDNIFDLQIHPDVEANDTGLEYEAYLRALLLIRKDSDRSAYTMNLIELAQIAAGQENFRFRNYIYSVTVSAGYEVRDIPLQKVYTTGYSY